MHREGWFANNWMQFEYEMIGNPNTGYLALQPKSYRVHMHVFFFDIKYLYFCPIEINKGLTDKGKFQYLTGNCVVYNTISFTKININI